MASDLEAASQHVGIIMHTGSDTTDCGESLSRAWTGFQSTSRKRDATTCHAETSQCHETRHQLNSLTPPILKNSPLFSPDFYQGGFKELS